MSEFIPQNQQEVDAYSEFHDKGVAIAFLLGSPELQSRVNHAETRAVGAEEHAQKMTEIAYKDVVTGLHNRRELENTLAGMLFKGKKVGVLFFDADKFKEVNDTRGHEAGDVVLKEVGGVIDATIRQTDAAGYDVGRWGGDEYLGILDLTLQPGPNRKEGLTTEQRLLGARTRLQTAIDVYVSENPDLQEKGFGVTVGAVLWDGKMSPEQLIDTADREMYKQKQLKKLQKS